MILDLVYTFVKRKRDVKVLGPGYHGDGVIEPSLVEGAGEKAPTVCCFVLAVLCEGQACPGPARVTVSVFSSQPRWASAEAAPSWHSRLEWWPRSRNLTRR